VVATLGKLTGEEPRQEAGWEQLESLLDGRPAAPRQMRLGEPVADAALAGPRWEVVGVRGVRVERARDFRRGVPRAGAVAAAGLAHAAGGVD
jgi:hypothetical protein